MAELIYKILNANQWQDAVEQGAFAGSQVDLQDGFIHFSSADQVQETADKHFAGQSDLVLVAVDPDSLPADQLKWETSRGGALFPHLYGTLLVTHAVSVAAIETDANGKHRISVNR